MLSLVGLLLLMVVVHDMSLKVAARDQGMLCVWNAPGWEWGLYSRWPARLFLGWECESDVSRWCGVVGICRWDGMIPQLCKGDCMLGRRVCWWRERLQLAVALVGKRSDPGEAGTGRVG